MGRDTETISISSQSTRSTNDEETVYFSFTDEKVAAARRAYLRAFIPGCVFVILSLMTFFSLYWGSLWKSPVRNLEGWVVDFDGGLVGQSVSSTLTSSQVTESGKVTWTSVPASQFPGGLGDLRDVIREQHAWVAVAIHEGSTQRLQASLASPNASYSPSEALTVYAVEARNENAFRNLIRPTVQTTLQEISDQFAKTSLGRLTASGANVNNILQSSPQTILTPIGYTIDNIIPFDVPVATAISYVGLIYQLIFSFFVVLIGTNTRMESGLAPKLTTLSLIRVRFASIFTAYFFISFFYALLNLAFQVDFTRKFGHGGFLIFWMLNWFGMLAGGLALEALITFLTPRFIPFFMIFWVISNVAVCGLPIEVLPVVFRYGYVAPFYNVSKAVRTIVFGTKNQVATNFAVLIVWIVISCVTIPLIQVYVRRRDRRAALKATEESDSATTARPSTEEKEK